MLSPGVIVRPGAIVRESVIATDCVIEKMPPDCAETRLESNNKNVMSLIFLVFILSSRVSSLVIILPAYLCLDICGADQLG